VVRFTVFVVFVASERLLPAHFGGSASIADSTLVDLAPQRPCMATRRKSMTEVLKNIDSTSEARYQASQSTWDKIAESQEFKDLMATKRIFIVPAFIFFVLYYFALPVLVGYAPQFMSTKVLGANLAYLFALSQFFVAWLIAGLYVKAANTFDRLAKDIVDKAEIVKGGK
jgi:uncharacterized membrane protein (DUF485 family)